jgi:hypothetical protein
MKEVDSGNLSIICITIVLLSIVLSIAIYNIQYVDKIKTINKRIIYRENNVPYKYDEIEMKE